MPRGEGKPAAGPVFGAPAFLEDARERALRFEHLRGQAVFPTGIGPNRLLSRCAPTGVTLAWLT
jgi:hypothetical protein